MDEGGLKTEMAQILDVMWDSGDEDCVEGLERDLVDKLMQELFQEDKPRGGSSTVVDGGTYREVPDQVRPVRTTKMDAEQEAEHQLLHGPLATAYLFNDHYATVCHRISAVARIFSVFSSW